MLARKKVVTPPVFRWFAFSAFLSMIVIVLTGAAVRLTGSGLGCPDWPTCFHNQVAGSWRIHPLIEYANRMVTVTLVVVTAITFIAALLRSPRRRDLIILASLLVVGVVLDAVLGAFVVYSKLNPWLVSTHMLLSLAMVVASAILYHRSKYQYGSDTRHDIRSPHFLRLARLLWLPTIVLLASGTMTTGAGPHAGSSVGQLTARRIPIAFSTMTWFHSLAAVLFVGLVVGLLASVWGSGAPLALQKGVRRLAVIALLQAAIGALQYLTHVPPLLVALHVLGATSLTIGVTQFHLRQTAHDREIGIAPSKAA